MTQFQLGIDREPNMIQRYIIPSFNNKGLYLIVKKWCHYKCSILCWYQQI